jgi:thiol-disulfide isomerase/thioredoxin
MRLAILMAAGSSLFGQIEYRGTLESELFVPGGLYERVTFQAGHDARFTGKIREALAVFVEPAALYVDVNGDGRFSADERYDLSSGFAEIRFPLPGPVYKTYPVTVYRGAQKSGECVLGESARAFVRGEVSIGGAQVTVGFGFDWKTNSVSPNNGWQGFEGEYSFVDDRRVYRAGDAYVRVGSVNLARREFVLEGAGRGDYTRIDLKAGEQFPDFSYVDFSGKTRQLSESGRTLLDFWATWCAPCIADLPRLRELHARGAEIIGMNVDQDPSKVRALNLPWPQAEFSSIRDLVEHRARIESYPTYVLLDEQHRIVAIGEDALGLALYCDGCDPSSLLRPGH